MIGTVKTKKIIKNHAIDFMLSLFFILLFITSSSVFADSVKPISSANSGYIFQVFTGLIIVIGMIFTVAALVKRFGTGSMLNNQHMRIVSSLSLGQKEKVIVIEAGEHQLLLGVTSQQITSLHKFDEPIVDLKIKDEMSDFTKKIHGFLNYSIKSNASEEENDSRVSNIEKDKLNTTAEGRHSDLTKNPFNKDAQ
ncbi:MAG: flagellar biosynthetic protein FliO [Cellvibrionaceae bacterium]